MRQSTCSIVSLFLLCTAAAAQQQPETPAPTDNIGHRRHLHRQNPPHPTVVDSSRFLTTRSGATLALPTEEDAFFFVVFGDRTGGPAKGVAVLADAVRDVNLFEPDLVMTVGDLVNGYNQTPQWLAQMREFKGIMDQLLCPWFPVAGNHDTYWRGPKEQRPENEHDANYEMHFGPLWYAFAHKNCWFIALYSDEGNPETGEKNFRKADCQRMSPAQFQWLSDVLDQAADADHVFCFLHHPRWLGGRYGDDWERVHQRLVDAGNVTAVFAGHIHRMRYDPRDGIEYVTLATVGGGQSELVPQAGYLHQYHVVTVRPDRIALAAVPVGEVMDVREITGSLQAECVDLARQSPQFNGQVKLVSTGQARGEFAVTLKNTASQPIDINVLPDSPDIRWRFTPDHKHATVAPGESQLFKFNVMRAAHTLDRDFQPLDLLVQMEYLADGHRYVIPEQRTAIPMDADLPAPPRPSSEHVLQLDGQRDCARLRPEQVRVPDGPLTLECWFNARAFGNRVGLITKTENSEFGIFVSKGVPSFSVFLGSSYANAKNNDFKLDTNRWYHVAGVYDGDHVRLYIDGQQIAATQRSGKRRTNGLPLFIGADVTGRGGPTSNFHGAIDEVRLSRVARYTDQSFDPQRRLAGDEDTLLLLHMDGALGPWLIDTSPQEVHPRLEDDARVIDHVNLN